METLPSLRLNEIQSMAEACVASGFFKDIRDAAKAVVKIQLGQELGIPPMASMRGIDFFDGNLSIRAHLMAAMIKKSGRYDYRIVEMTSTSCKIDFYERGELLGSSEFTEEDAKAAVLLGKDNWKKNPKDMYYNRAMSKGARAYCPDIFWGGAYDEDEHWVVPQRANTEPEDVPPWPTRDEYSPPEGLKLETLEDIDRSITDTLIRQGVIPEDTEALIERTLGSITRDHAQVAIDIAPWSRLRALWFNKYAAILRERAGISTDEYRAYMAKNFPDVEGPGKLSKAQQQQVINWLSVAVEEPRDLTYASVASAVIQMTGMKAIEVAEWLMDTFGMGVDSDMALLEMVSKTIADYDPEELRSALRTHSIATEAP